MDIQELTRVIDELSHLAGGRVERVYVGGGTELYLAIRLERKNYFLLFSPDRTMPRLHLVSKKPAATASPRGFGLYLRGRLTGSRITSAALLNQDRVAEFRFAWPGAEEYRLVFELIGAAANIIITDSSSTILAVYYPVSPGDTVKRALLPGLAYELPEKGPVRAQGALPSASPRADTGSGNDFAVNREMERRYDRIVETRYAETLRSALRSLVKKALAKTDKKMKALSADFVNSDRAEEYRHAGEAILANLDKLKTGLERAVLTGYDGNTIDVRLDQKRSPQSNAELYFKKYKKAKSGRTIIAARLRGIEDEEARLKSFQSRIEQGEGHDELEAIRSRLVRSGYLREREPIGRKRAAPPAPFRTVEYAGWEILVGKSASGNDYLTTKIAHPHDLWLHAEGMPGSHVLVRNPDAAIIPPAVFARAASLAAFYSKGKSAGKVAVAYTLARHVKKPKGAKPGLVTLMERKTIMAVPETD